MTISTSLLIRHSRTLESWETLSYEGLTDLITQKSDPPLDNEFLVENADLEKLKQMAPTEIYSSPLRRAFETARFISDEIKGIPVRKVAWLKEIKFGQIPYSTYLKGPQAIRLYLIEETKKAKIVMDKGIFSGSALVISHGFLMRRIFTELLGGNFDALVDDSRFVNYLSGFDYKTGTPFSLLKLDI